MKVCMLHVGGTIGMAPTGEGYKPDPGLLQRFLEGMPELRHPDVPDYDLVPLPPLLDSADMAPSDWARIAEAIEARYADYAGFVVVHGTDTMAYTASALSFLLAGLDKPVVLTGAQLPLGNIRTDGREHVVTALLLAGRYRIPEVGIYFGARLLRGNRAQKIRNNDFIAFASGNCPPLASVGVRIDVDARLVRPPGPGLRTRRLARAPEVAAIRIYPGITPHLLEGFLEPPAEALVLETYGAGNFPSRDPALLRPIRAAVDRGVVVVNCSQCHSGYVQQDLYRTGHTLADAGVVSGRDMTPEAALTKLYCLLGSGETPARVRELVGQDLAGELDPR